MFDPSTIRKRSRLVLAAIAACGGLFVAGCATTTVPPSQRAELAKPEMDPATATRVQEETFHLHIESAREGSLGGHGGQGGGCGCG